MTLVEKVARAICTARGLDPDEDGESDYDDYARPSTDVACPAWMRYRESARAAIEALEIPNERMVAAGAKLLNIVPENLARDLACAVWEDMIRAELADKGGVDG